MLAVGAVALPSSVTAQDAATTPTDRATIVVTGRSKAEKERVSAAVRAMAQQRDRNEPVGRFAAPICFATAGLPQDLLASIADRVIADAQLAGLQLAGDGCRPNLLLIFVNDGRADMDWLRTKHSDWFWRMDLADIHRIVEEPGPVHVFTASEIVSRDGERMSVDPQTDVPQLNVSISSNIVLPVRRDIQASIMLIDRVAVPGRTAIQIADYAALRTLAMIRPQPVQGIDTIMSLFNPTSASPPAEMTAFDRGYLKALYAGAGNERATLKLDRIASTIVAERAAEVGPDRP
ncbi:hypothetical protein Q5H91_14780 [Sphingomonas sp. KR1UV-12]|uniref:DUF2066 domain-containing protein n=1 Tax=Sphingomonas aurea TaxID=3063994 RepID=A0ABT9ENF5_9SPHN|nr:hypothetical protein [Sphingomonas sp. KR1UV-12]MDP1028485.1 hypothetical protein [Sphingomonas sp. KR1UV-12]